MDDFADVARARAAYLVYAEALNKGRDLLTRAGMAAAPPPIPEFDTVFQRLDRTGREELYCGLRDLDEVTTADAMRLWKAAIARVMMGKGTR